MSRPTVAITMGKMLDQTGYLKDLRDENTEEANERIENLMELVSAAREYETREEDASIGGSGDRLEAAWGDRNRRRPTGSFRFVP